MTRSICCTTDASPGAGPNIDHLAVTRSGVFVIDAKKYKGRTEAQD